MRSERAVISNDIVRYGVSCIAEAYVTHHWHSFVLQTPENEETHILFFALSVRIPTRDREIKHRLEGVTKGLPSQLW